MTCDAADTAEALRAALAAHEMTIIVAKCDSGNVKVPVIDMNPVMIRERFMDEVARPE